MINLAVKKVCPVSIKAKLSREEISLFIFFQIFDEDKKKVLNTVKVEASRIKISWGRFFTKLWELKLCKKKFVGSF